jgi:hypothetical protein
MADGAASDRRRLPVAVFICCLTLTSCGAKPPVGVPVHKAKGTIHFDGKPLAGATLIFHSKVPVSGPDNKPIPVPGANSSDDGSFLVSTFLPGDGLSEGEYDVTMSCEDRNGKLVRDEYPELLPARYQNRAKSGLRATITAGNNDLQPFELKR